MTKRTRRRGQRADEMAVALGLANDARRAGALIMAGQVMLIDPEGHERRIDKPGERVSSDSRMRLLGMTRVFASRAGQKLEGALDAFGIDPRGWICADIGISTGGFTDCLLRRGALRVHGVDVGYGQVAWEIRSDPRVHLYERTNARTLPPLAFGELVRLAAIDVSFISLGMIFPSVIAQLEPRGEIVALVKPQFELKKERVPNGIVSDDRDRRRAVQDVLASAAALGLDRLADIESSVPGVYGNLEHLIHLRRTSGTS